MTMRIAALVVLLLAALALAPSMPYGFYPVMRWPLCVAACSLAFYAHQQRSTTWTWLWVAVAGIYNPIVPVHSTRAIWSIVNIATIVVALVQLATPRKQTQTP